MSVNPTPSSVQIWLDEGELAMLLDGGPKFALRGEDDCEALEAKLSEALGRAREVGRLRKEQSARALVGLAGPSPQPDLLREDRRAQLEAEEADARRFKEAP